jgi:hypothetical protein
VALNLVLRESSVGCVFGNIKGCTTWKYVVGLLMSELESKLRNCLIVKRACGSSVAFCSYPNIKAGSTGPSDSALMQTLCPSTLFGIRWIRGIHGHL